MTKTINFDPYRDKLDRRVTFWLRVADAFGLMTVLGMLGVFWCLIAGSDFVVLLVVFGVCTACAWAATRAHSKYLDALDDWSRFMHRRAMWARKYDV